MIESWHVREALRFRFGSALVDIPGIWDHTAALLRDYAPYRDSFADLAGRLEDAVFNAVYEQLGPSTGAQMDDGTVRRIRTSDALHEYCMSAGSFSAIRVLYTRYAEFMPASERKILARIIRDSRPRSVWETILDPEDYA